MKRLVFLTSPILVLLLIVAVIPANPLKETILSELLFDKDGGWHMEIGNIFSTTNLDGWYLKSKTDSALFKNGLRLSQFGFFVFSNDSLKKPLTINPLGDSISLFSPQGRRDLLTFGKEYWKSVSAPRYGQSICQDKIQFYLDNTPTLGLANDTANAMGTLRFLVQDSLGHPVSLAAIAYYPSLEVPQVSYTSSSGAALASWVGRRMSFYVSADGFSSQQIFWTQIYPESTITIPVTLSMAPDAVKNLGISGLGSFALDNPYPNPFNPQVVVEYTLPRNGVVDISVYDVSGKLVAEIFSGKQSAGKNVARWEAAAYPSGVYLIRVKTTDGMAMKKCLLLK